MIKNNQIQFMAGLPRAGSTLLTNLLAQHPDLHCTSTNGLSNLLINSRDSWSHIPEFKSQGIDKLVPRITNMLQYSMYGFYYDELSSGKTVIDKDRNWQSNINLLEDVLGYKVKVIVPVRNIADICASFISLENSNPLIANSLFSSPAARLSVRSKVQDLLSDTGVVGRCINNLTDSLNSSYSDRLLILPVSTLTNNPKIVLDELLVSLGLPPFDFQLDNIPTLVEEDDSVYGLPGLHTIRPNISPIQSRSEEVLGKHLTDEINLTYNYLKPIIG